MPPHFPNLDALLADPLVQAVMAADRVDPAALKRDLQRVAANLPRKPRPLDLAGARVHFAPYAQRYPVNPMPPVQGPCEARLCC